MMKFEDGTYYIGGKNRVGEMWACMNNEVVFAMLLTITLKFL